MERPRSRAVSMSRSNSICGTASGFLFAVTTWKPCSSASCSSGAVSSEVRSTRMGRYEGRSHSSSCIMVCSCLRVSGESRSKSLPPAALCLAMRCSAGAAKPCSSILIPERAAHAEADDSDESDLGLGVDAVDELHLPLQDKRRLQRGHGMLRLGVRNDEADARLARCLADHGHGVSGG